MPRALYVSTLLMLIGACFALTMLHPTNRGDGCDESSIHVVIANRMEPADGKPFF
jgi:hypothetical protein